MANNIGSSRPGRAGDRRRGSPGGRGGTGRRPPSSNTRPSPADTTKNAPKSSPVSDKKKVLNIADCMMSVQMTDGKIVSLDGGVDLMLSKCKNAASVLGRPHDIVPSTDSGEPPNHGELQVIRGASNKVIDVIDEVNDFVSRARAAGFSPPSNPFSEIARFNESRSVLRNKISPSTIENDLAEDIMFNISVFLDLMKKEKEGELSFTKRGSRKAAQIASYTISLDGYATTAVDTATDILSFMPNADNVKRRRIREALGALNFKDRIPQILFTCNYDPDGISKGIVVGWRKMPDASGYIIDRHSVFDNEDKTIKFNNKGIAAEYALVKDYVDEWVLSFYDKVDADDVYAFLDKDIKQHNFYTYKIKAFQDVRTDREFIFSVDSTPFVLSQIALNDIEREMKSHMLRVFGPKFKVDDNVMGLLMSTGEFSVDDISPYPFLSKKFYGTDKFDWIIAAMNIRAAKSRGENKSDVRRYSYLGAKMSFIREKMGDSKIIRPIDTIEIENNINDSIAAFGVSQTIQEIISATGLDLFFGSKERPGDETFKRASDVFDDSEVSGISKILSAIDPDTATVEVSALANNLMSSTSENDLLHKMSILSSPQEIDVPKPSNKTDEEFSEDVMQFVGDLDSAEEVLDLTTFEGLSNFVRMIRLFFDMNPNRSSFSASEDAALDFKKLSHLGKIV